MDHGLGSLAAMSGLDHLAVMARMDPDPFSGPCAGGGRLNGFEGCIRRAVVGIVRSGVPLGNGPCPGIFGQIMPKRVVVPVRVFGSFAHGRALLA